MYSTKAVWWGRSGLIHWCFQVLHVVLSKHATWEKLQTCWIGKCWQITWQRVLAGAQHWLLSAADWLWVRVEGKLPRHDSHKRSGGRLDGWQKTCWTCRWWQVDNRAWGRWIPPRDGRQLCLFERSRPSLQHSWCTNQTPQVWTWAKPSEDLC